MGRFMQPRRLFALLLVSLAACGGAVSDEGDGLGLGDWNLSYVDAGSYYGSSSSSSGSTNTDEDASVTTDASATDSATDISDSSTPAPDANGLAPH